MNKNQKILLGVAGVAIVGYLYWKNKQTTPTAKMVGGDGTIFNGTSNKPLFKNADGSQAKCMCHTSSQDVNGKTVYTCKSGNKSYQSAGMCKA